MGRRSNDFQRLMLHVYEQLASSQNARVGESVLLAERTGGAQREVDILLEADIAGHAIRIAIECRDRGRKSDIEWIDALIGKYSRLPVNKVVAVSRSGFTNAAEIKAASCDQPQIELRTLRQCNNTDWPAELDALWVALVDRTDTVMSVELELEPKIVGKLTEALAVTTAEGMSHGSLQQYLTVELWPAVHHQVSNLIDTRWKEFFGSLAEFESSTWTAVIQIRPTLRCLVIDDGGQHEIVAATYTVKCVFSHHREAGMLRRRYENTVIYQGIVDAGDIGKTNVTVLQNRDTRAITAYIGEKTLQFPDSPQSPSSLVEPKRADDS